MSKGQTNNPNGRPKGRPNRVTAEVRGILSEAIHNNAERIQELFDQVANEDPAKAVDLWIRMCSYVVPRPKPEEVDLEEDNRVTDIEVRIINSREELEEHRESTPITAG